MTWDGAHNKRVTLNLARRSEAAKAIPGLVAAIDALDAAGWDMYKLAQGDVELIYTSFDDEMEERVKAEFEADPGFLVDHGHNYTDCKLCGQYPIRFEFKINGKNGSDVNCGIDCIVNHSLHVKGAETSEAARKVLEAAIRRQLRKVRLEKWHEVTAFNGQHFNRVLNALAKARSVRLPDEGWEASSARSRNARHLQREVVKLERFYARAGWLGTESKWTTWTDAIKLARQWGDCMLPVPMGFAESMGKLPSEELKDATPEAQPEAAPAPASPVAEAHKKPKQLDLFEQVSQQLVFGDQ